MIVAAFLDGMARAAVAAVHFLTPARCCVCRCPLMGYDNAALCAPCLDKVEWIGPGACARCGYPAGPHASLGDQGCGRCRGRDLGLTGMVSVARYAEGARHLVRALKFGGQRGLAGSMAGLMAERWRGCGFFGKADLIIPVSLHRERLRTRGFDQAALLAEGAARELSLEFGEGFMRRVRFTRPQALLRREDRLRAMEGAFRAEGDMAGRRVILVDDVVTTGTTMSACARACRNAGASRVYGLSFAR